MHELIARLASRGLDLVAPLDDSLLVGNTRALWPHFVAWLDAARREQPHPLEAYVEESVAYALAGAACTVRYAHDGPPYVPIQRLAEKAGLAWLAPSNLAIHPVYGPWLSLRAVLTFAAPVPLEPLPAAPPCSACEHACAPAFAKALSGLDRSDPGASARASWQDWLAVRDACPIGRAHRFQEDHILYGYTKDRRALRG